MLAAAWLAGVVAGVLAGSALAIAAGAVVAVQLARVAPAARQRQAQLAHQARRRELQQRRDARLDVCCAPALDLPELTELVDGCIPCGTYDPFDLDALLDRYADLAIARHRCFRLLSRASRASLEASLDIARVSRPKSAQTIERRLAHADEVRRLARTIEESLAELGELVRYYAERARQPEIDDVLERGLVGEVIERLDAAA